VKRLDLIIAVLQKLKLTNLKWIHFGDGPLRKEIENIAKKKLVNLKFEFKGLTPNNEILDFYHENFIDLFLNLSDSEGIPVSIMEALSAGIPVLATDVGGTGEVVNNNHGFLIPQNLNSDEVAHIINNYFYSESGLNRKLRENAYKYWEENYNAESNYMEFFNLLSKV
jgi:colanic acid/amylovoran biosynthesis glycosyltransferase